MNAWKKAVAYYETHPDECEQHHGEGRRRLAQGPDGVRRASRRCQVLQRDANNTFFGTTEKPGPLYKIVQNAMNVWCEPRQDAGEGDAEGPHQLLLRQLVRRPSARRPAGSGASGAGVWMARPRPVPWRCACASGLRPRSHPGGVYLTVSALAGLVLFVGWALLAYGGLRPPDFLPPPHRVAPPRSTSIADGSLWLTPRVGVVIFTGFLLASVVAVPLGILMGSFKIVEAALEPVVDFIRYLPVTALIPLLILWIGSASRRRSPSSSSAPSSSS